MYLFSWAVLGTQVLYISVQSTCPNKQWNLQLSQSSSSMSSACLHACACWFVTFLSQRKIKGSSHAFCQHNGPLSSLTWFSILSFSFIAGLTGLSLFTFRSFLGLPLIYPSLHAPQTSKPSSLVTEREFVYEWKLSKAKPLLLKMACIDCYWNFLVLYTFYF